MHRTLTFAFLNLSASSRRYQADPTDKTTARSSKRPRLRAHTQYQRSGPKRAALPCDILHRLLLHSSALLARVSQLLVPASQTTDFPANSCSISVTVFRITHVGQLATAGFWTGFVVQFDGESEAAFASAEPFAVNLVVDRYGTQICLNEVQLLDLQDRTYKSETYRIHLPPHPHLAIRIEEQEDEPTVTLKWIDADQFRGKERSRRRCLDKHRLSSHPTRRRPAGRPEEGVSARASS